MHLKLNDFVIRKSDNKLGVVTEVNDYWGWAVVTFEGGKKRGYDNSSIGNRTLTVLTPEARADYFLYRENAGITDSWRE